MQPPGAMWDFSSQVSGRGFELLRSSGGRSGTVAQPHMMRAKRIRRSQSPCRLSEHRLRGWQPDVASNCGQWFPGSGQVWCGLTPASRLQRTGQSDRFDRHRYRDYRGHCRVDRTGPRSCPAGIILSQDRTQSHYWIQETNQAGGKWSEHLFPRGMVVLPADAHPMPPWS